MRTLALAAVLAGLAVPTTAAEREVAVAFRTDAPPFSVAEDGTYRGFIAALCEAAVSRAGYSISERTEIAPTDRQSLREEGGIDLVCDPTTVTVARARRTDFSPIVFIANSGFLRSPEPKPLSDSAIDTHEACRTLRAENPDRVLLGAVMVAGTTARATYELARAKGHAADTMEHLVCPIEVANHDAGIAAFCDGAATYYFGDLDILHAAVARHGDCPARETDAFRAYEPYAIAIPTQDDAFRRAFVSALYALFSEGAVTEIYADAFGSTQMSEPLQMLFRVNSVPRGAVATD
jgi:polar amino acid transport system substrate-binding protein/glutamate/aspartate transport system substrate-binding protein